MQSTYRQCRVRIVSAMLVLCTGLFVSTSLLRGQVQVFKAPQAFPAGPNPAAEVSGDLNADGKPDLVVANNSSATITVLLGKGDGTFQSPKSFAVGNVPSSLALGDFNADGKLDIAVANASDGTASILLGRGDGSFQPAVNYTYSANPAVNVSVGAAWLSTADLNSDGKPDLVISGATSSGGGILAVLLGNGDGTFQPVVSQSTNVAGYGFNNAFGAIGDFNGDGKVDVALGANYGKEVCTPLGCHNYDYHILELFLGNGDGTLQNYTVASNLDPTFGFAAGNFNADGNLDIAVSTLSNGTEILLGNGDGTFQAPITYGGGPGPIAVGDLNGDGKLDIAIGSEFTADGVIVLLGNGDGTFQGPTDYAAGPSQAGIAIADFNGDGKLDLAETNNVSNGATTILLGNGDGSFGPVTPELQVGSFPLFVAAGDFNADGKLDFIVASNAGPVSIVLGNGDGTFQSANALAINQGNPATVATADLNGDNTIDLVLGNGGTGLMVMLGNGDGTFQSPVSYSTANSVAYPTFAIGDLNGDHKPDLVMADGYGNLDILLGNGDGSFQAPVTSAFGQTCGTVFICLETPALGDFNGDGKLDLAVPDVEANTVDILLGNGDGTFQTAVTYPVGSQPTVAAVADFNGDGKLDLAVGNNGDGTVSILRGNGDGTFQATTNYPVGASGPGQLVVGDFNGDGILDVASQGNGLASVLLGRGDGTFQPQLSYAFGGAQPGNGIAAGDFNGDYTADLVVVGGIGGTTASVLFNTAGFVLYTSESGAGAGSVTSVPSGINCSSPCSASFAGASTITLTATANSSSNFSGWSGACSGMGPCTVIMKAATSVTANFALQDFSLSPASTSLSVQAGGQAADVITISGLNGAFSNAIQLTCTVSGPAPQPTCNFSSSSVTPGGNGATSSLTVAAPTNAAAMDMPSDHRQSKAFYALLIPFIFAITVVAGSRKPRCKHWALCSMLLLPLLLQIACSSGSSNGGGKQGPTNYTVMITGSSGAIQHTIQVAVTVQ